MSTALLYGLIILLALIGLSVCAYIHSSKVTAKPLVCPLDSDCNAVIQSKYSSVFGVAIEVWGALYYILIIIAYTILLFTPQLVSPAVHGVLTFVTLGAFLFSLYLTSVQAFVIREWCAWCLSSAFLSTLIYILSQISSPIHIVEIIKKLFS